MSRLPAYVLAHRLAFERQRPCRILDLGLADPRGAALLQERAENQLFGWDDALRVPPGVTAVGGGGLPLPVADGAFDLIICGDLLDRCGVRCVHWLDEIRRLISKDGIVLISVSNWFADATLARLPRNEPAPAGALDYYALLELLNRRFAHAAAFGQRAFAGAYLCCLDPTDDAEQISLFDEWHHPAESSSYHLFVASQSPLPELARYALLRLPERGEAPVETIDPRLVDRLELAQRRVVSLIERATEVQRVALETVAWRQRAEPTTGPGLAPKRECASPGVLAADATKADAQAADQARLLLAAKVERLEQTVAQRTASLTHLQQAIESSRLEQQRLQQGIEQARAARQQAEKRAERGASELADERELTTALREQLASTIERADSERNQLAVELAATRERLSAVDAELRVAKTAAERNETALAEQTARLEQVQADFAAFRDEFAAVASDELSEPETSSEQELLLAELEGHRQRSGRLTDQVRQLAKQRDELRLRRQTMKEDLNNLRHTLQLVTSERDQLAAESVAQQQSAESWASRRAQEVAHLRRQHEAECERLQELLDKRTADLEEAIRQRDLELEVRGTELAEAARRLEKVEQEIWLVREEALRRAAEAAAAVAQLERVRERRDVTGPQQVVVPKTSGARSPARPAEGVDLLDSAGGLPTADEWTARTNGGSAKGIDRPPMPTPQPVARLRLARVRASRDVPVFAGGRSDLPPSGDGTLDTADGAAEASPIPHVEG
ncbi:MAG: hypothetical protein H6707_03315 [Deltaproteobacteria bacterium]|nr:hypothetical protein [Deltaproteobacteria bacterium]